MTKNGERAKGCPLATHTRYGIPFCPVLVITLVVAVGGAAPAVLASAPGSTPPAATFASGHPAYAYPYCLLLSHVPCKRNQKIGYHEHGRGLLLVKIPSARSRPKVFVWGCYYSNTFHSITQIIPIVKELVC